MSNPLVAGPVSMTTPFTGTFLLEDGESLAHAIENGDWVEGGLAAFSGVLDTVAAVSDPLGSLIAAGLGWLIEHVEPLSGWFNDLTGDAGQVAGFAQTWANVATRMHESGDLYTRRLSDLDEMSGATIDAYLAYANDVAKHLHAVGDWSQAVSTGLQICSTLVKIVHDLVRDALSQIVGMAISVATEAVLTVGLATPLIIEQVATRVSSLATRIGTSVTRLLTSFKSFSALFEALQELLRKGKTLFDRLPPGKAGIRALHAETPPSYTGAPLPRVPLKATGRARPLFPDSFDPYPGQSVEEFLAKHWDFERARCRYPLNDGFDVREGARPIVEAPLVAGFKFDRFGYETGGYVSPLGSTFPERALPPDAILKPYARYEMLKPLDAESGFAKVGPIAPAFEQPGGGTQIVLPKSVDWLIRNKYVGRITR